MSTGVYWTFALLKMVELLCAHVERRPLGHPNERFPLGFSDLVLGALRISVGGVLSAPTTQNRVKNAHGDVAWRRYRQAPTAVSAARRRSAA